MKPLVMAICVAFVYSAVAVAQTGAWQPSPGHEQVLIWPDAAPDAQPVPGPETMSTDPTFLVAGKPVKGIDNVTRPTMTVYSPKVRGYRRGGGRVPRRRL